MSEISDRDVAQANIIEQDRQRERMPEPPVADHSGSSARAPDRSMHEESDEPAHSTGSLSQPPELVRKRYLHAGHQYFLKDEPHRLAFEDQGRRLITEHNRADIAESMVDMAAAKGWRRIRVSGHSDFRREAWLQASLRCLAVTGYEPQAVDRARLAELREYQMTNRIEPAPERTRTYPAQHVTTATGNGKARDPDRERPAVDVAARRSALKGMLLEHGSAPYQHNPGHSDSYYLIYRDREGEDHIVWGVDLERAIGEPQAQVGDAIRLENLGRHWVTVEVPVRDAAGTAIGVENKEVYRNTWQLDVIGRDKAYEAPVASNKDQPANDAPALNRAIADPVRVAPNRERSPSISASSPDKALHLTVIVEAMRAQGFSEKSVAKVQARAVRMLDTFQTMGAEVPAPKVYDVKAPSSRKRDRATSNEARDRTREKGREKGRVRVPSEPSLPSL